MICLFFILILIICCNAYLDAPKVVRVIGSGAEPGQNDNGYSSDNQQKFGKSVLITCLCCFFFFLKYNNKNIHVLFIQKHIQI